MTIIKWRTIPWDEIKRVECERESASVVWVKDMDWHGKPMVRRHSKQSSFENYHDSWQDAHAFLLERAQNQLESARINFSRAHGAYRNVKGMKPPAEAQ